MGKTEWTNDVVSCLIICAISIGFLIGFMAGGYMEISKEKEGGFSLEFTAYDMPLTYTIYDEIKDISEISKYNYEGVCCESKNILVYNVTGFYFISSDKSVVGLSQIITLTNEEEQFDIPAYYQKEGIIYLDSQLYFVEANLIGNKSIWICVVC